jgi:hypothetical protein
MNHNSELKILKNKVILLISPQPWGSLYISKNHYAIELAKNNIVYYLCPQPKIESSSNNVNIKSLEGIDNLYIIEHKLFFPFEIKFHFRSIFRFLMSLQTKRVLKKINRNIDIVWSFDLGNYFPFSFFSKVPVKIFHPVDEPLNSDAINSAKNADIIFSVTNEILEKYSNYKLPKYFVNHGVSESFLNNTNQTEKSKSNHLHVGISGNLRRKDIDREAMLTIVKNHPEIIFDCWGEYQADSHATNKEKLETDFFINSLKSNSNVRLHGLLNPDNLAEAYLHVDAFLICYDVVKDQSKGTNYHKVMEFISTGKIIISNNITTYKDSPHLVQMVESRNNNLLLPELFSTTIENLDYFNATHFQIERKVFAINNSYKNQLLLIDQALISFLN